MPLARTASNKQIFPWEIVAPGTLGLNSEQSGALLDASWASDTLNCVIDSSARLAARLGANRVTGTPIAPVQFSISAISLGATTTITYLNASQAFVTGVTVNFSGIVGTVELNGSSGVISATATVVGGVSYSITVTINSTNFTTWASAGTINTVAPFMSLFEGNIGGSVTPLIGSWAAYGPSGLGGGITNSYNSPAANNIKGSVNVGTGRWFFQNFNNKVIGFLNGHTPIVWTGTGNFTTITASAGSVPTGGIGCTAFGRVWTVQSDLQTIQYSALLDETSWATTAGADSGVVDMHTVWSAGTDQVTAIFAFNSSLIICGTKHIVCYTDGRGSLLGIDPTQMYVYDILTGTGCLSQFSVQAIGQSDVLFASTIGVQSLARLTTNDNNPLISPAKYNRTQLMDQIAREIPLSISGTYDALQGFYLMALPVSGIIWCFDVRRPFQDPDGDVCYRTTYWTMRATALASGQTDADDPVNAFNVATYIARTQGAVCLYAGSTDEDTSYDFNWTSPWLVIAGSMMQPASARIKLLKRVEAMIVTANSQTIAVSFSADFGISTGAVQTALGGTGVQSQYGLGQYGLSQYGGGVSTSRVSCDLRGRGQFYQFAINTVVNGTFAVAEVHAAWKIGRII